MCHFNENRAIIEEQEIMISEPKVEERGLSLPDFEHLYHYAFEKEMNANGHEGFVYMAIINAYESIIKNNLYFFWKSLTLTQQCDYFMCYIGAEYERGSKDDELDAIPLATLYNTLQEVKSYEIFERVIKKCFYEFFDISFCTHGMMYYQHTRVNNCLISRLRKYAKMERYYPNCNFLEQFKN